MRVHGHLHVERRVAQCALRRLIGEFEVYRFRPRLIPGYGWRGRGRCARRSARECPCVGQRQPGDRGQRRGKRYGHSGIHIACRRTLNGGVVVNVVHKTCVLDVIAATLIHDKAIFAGLGSGDTGERLAALRGSVRQLPFIEHRIAGFQRNGRAGTFVYGAVGKSEIAKRRQVAVGGGSAYFGIIEITQRKYAAGIGYIDRSVGKTAAGKVLTGIFPARQVRHIGEIARFQYGRASVHRKLSLVTRAYQYKERRIGSGAVIVERDMR